MNTYRSLTFALIFGFSYVFGGTINHFLPEIKIFSLTLLCLPFFYIFRKSDIYIYIIGFFLLVEFTISTIKNNSEIYNLLIYARLVYIPIALTILVDKSIQVIHREKFKEILLLIGVIQLPVVFIQQEFYSFLSSFSRLAIDLGDYDFGTFGIQNDFSLSFYLTGLVLLLLHTNYFNLKIILRICIAIWLTLTVLTVNSSISYFSVALLWLIYFKDVFKNGKLAFIFLLFFLILIYFYINSDNFTGRLPYIIEQLDFENIDEQLIIFTDGKYSRLGGVAYFLNEPLKIFGDGPLHYYNPFTREYLLRITGHALSFYSEVGVLGLILSYLFCFVLIQKSLNRGMPLIFIWFICLLMLSLTVNIFSDVSVLLTYIIIGRLLCQPINDENERVYICPKCQ